MSQEDIYFNEPQCGTCRWHCATAKTKETNNGRVPPPWVCGCENCKSFNRPVKADTHKTCKCWERRDPVRWLNEYTRIRLTKNPETRAPKYRNLMFMIDEIRERYNYICGEAAKKEHVTRKAVIIYAVARHFGISQNDVCFCLDADRKE